MKTFQFQCSYCDKKYRRESAYIDHECREMRRSKEIKTIRGQRAYMYYVYYNKLKRYAQPTELTFITSSSYLGFIKFEKFVKSTRLPSPLDYMTLMTDHGLGVNAWTDSIAYSKYVEYIDRRMPPIKQAGIAIDTIFNICERNNADTADFFEIIPAGEFIKCVIRRQLSAWILFNSNKFIEFYDSEMNDSHRIIFDGIMPPDDWADKFKSNRKSARAIKKMVIELGL